MVAGFSRLQLAAALLEYDNDPDNPDAPHRSAHESAIFAHLRRNAGTPAHVASRRSDYLAVSLPSEGGSLGGQESAFDNRRSRTSRGSIDALRNPFSADDNFEDEDMGEGDELEVDLASWGLDAFMPKDKVSKNIKGKTKSAPYPVSSVPSHQPLTSNDAIETVPKRALGASRSMSVGGNLEYFGTANIPSSSLADGNRRRSFGSPLDLVGMEPPQMPMHRRRASSYTIIENRSRPPQSVPFPTAPPLHLDDETDRRTSLSPRPDPNTQPHERTRSSISMGSRLLIREHEQVQDDRPHSTSNTTMPTVLPADDNPFALRPPSRVSRFDPKAAAHARTLSNVSMASPILSEVDRVSDMTGQALTDRERRYSTTLELLRPKVLVMPSPLQPAAAAAPPPNDKLRDGFQSSTDGPPLPPGARSTRRSSATLSLLDPSTSVSPPIASNSFTPNPLMNLSLSQQTFRNTLMVGGQSGPIYQDLVPRATQDGEQIHLDLSEPEVDFRTPAPHGMDHPSEITRPAGKLYGKSLIDDLENRKAQMRSKQRVFTGDQRPSMMAREQQQRSSTLIDQAALHTRPLSQRIPSYGSQTVGRRNSTNAKPLLNFDDDKKDAHKDTLLPSSRSVFGVDTLWEREMAKLQEIEAQERLEAEQRRKREQEGDKQAKKKKRKGKSEGDDPGAVPPAMEATSRPRVTATPPILPDIERAAQKKRPPVPDDYSESDDSEFAGPSGTQTHDTDPKWFSGSSDNEDNGPRRTTGVGLRYPSKSLRGHNKPTGGDSDDDIPLSTTVRRVIQRTARQQQIEGDSDDEAKPLSTLLQKQQSLPRIDFDSLLEPSQPVEDDDNQPLGLRVSRVASSLHGQSHAGADDDDRPLAYHPEQQRRTQYQMLAQQQQFMMQAQLQNSMFFSPSPMMGPTFFNPTMVPPMMMQPPMPIPSPLPIHDEAKYGRVNKWRHDVAIEGET